MLAMLTASYWFFFFFGKTTLIHSVHFLEKNLYTCLIPIESLDMYVTGTIQIITQQMQMEQVAAEKRT